MRRLVASVAIGIGVLVGGIGLTAAPANAALDTGACVGHDWFFVDGGGHGWIYDSDRCDYWP